MDGNYRKSVEAKRNIKRYVITALCAIPILILIGVILGKNCNRVLRIFIFVLALLVIFIIEEIIHAKLERKKPKVEEKDIFK